MGRALAKRVAFCVRLIRLSGIPPDIRVVRQGLSILVHLFASSTKPEKKMTETAGKVTTVLSMDDSQRKRVRVAVM